MANDATSSAAVETPEAPPTAPVGKLSPINYQDLATSMAGKYGVDPGIFNRLISTESSWNPKAISPKGAIGLGQLMPDTAASMQVDANDPVSNLEGSAKYLSQLYQKYGDYSKALAAYNAGPDAVDKAGGIPNIPETQNYVAKIMQDIPKGPVGKLSPYSGAAPGQPQSTAQPTAAGGGQSQPPATPTGPGAANRFASSATNTFGLPADVRDWPSTFKSMVSGPIPVGKIPWYDPTKYAMGGANAIGNMIKGMGGAASGASQEGLDMMKQPGISSKLGGFERYIIGGIPQVGPNLVRWADQLSNGDVAGSMGTIAGIGLQGLMSMPDAAAAKLQGAAQYMIAKPRVQETILASEANNMMTSAEKSARAEGHEMYPETNQSANVAPVVQSALDKNIKGSPDVPAPLKIMLGDESYKRWGAIDNADGTKTDIFTRLTDNTSIPAKEIQGYYSEIGRRMAQGNLPGDIYGALKDSHEGLGKMLSDMYYADGKGPQWEDAQTNWARLAQTWWDKDSPLAQSMKAQDATAILKPLLGDQKERATKYLQDYINHGADPNIIPAAEKFYRGMDKMQFRGLWRTAGPLMMGAYIARAAGVPYGDAMAMGIIPVIAAKMGLGWLATRPSMTDILAGVPPKVAGEPWIPRTSPFQPYRPGNPLLVPAGKIPTP